MYEYAVSDGEGTLYEYGHVENLWEIDGVISLALINRCTVIIADADPDCVTGE